MPHTRITWQHNGQTVSGHIIQIRRGTILARTDTGTYTTLHTGKERP